MAGSSLFALLDDIASVLDDVAVMTKVAAKKTAGVLGDDLALNAQQVSGIAVDRELPVVWEVSKGSLKNKAILVPLALIISAIAPIMIMPLLMFGGVFLCYEGVEKLAHKLLHSKAEDKAHHNELIVAIANPEVDILAFEKNKIKNAIRTDFILSAEIITITLGSVAGKPLLQQIGVLIGIALIMTVGVYGLVAAIVKLDDLGLYLNGRSLKFQRGIGKAILWLAPCLMKTLSVVGTAAMFLVGGGILIHGFAWAHHMESSFTQLFAEVALFGAIWKVLSPLVFSATVGVLAGSLALLLVTFTSFLWKKLKK